MKPVSMGYGDAKSYFEFKAARAYSTFVSKPTRENVLEAAAALWDTVDWIWRDQYPGVDERRHQSTYQAFQKGLFARCSDLELMRDLADAQKHGGHLSRSSVRVKAISGSTNPGGINQEFGPLGMVEHASKCALQIDLISRGSRDLSEALKTALVFLRSKIG